MQIGHRFFEVRIGFQFNSVNFSQVPLFVLSRLLSSLWVSRTGSASDWFALQEAPYKCTDTIQQTLEHAGC